MALGSMEEGDGVAVMAEGESSPSETRGESGYGNDPSGGRGEDKLFRFMKWSKERFALVKISPPPRNWLRNSCLG